MHLAVLLFSLPRAALNTLWELVVDIVVVPARYLLPDPMPTPIFPELPPIKIPPNLLDPVPYPPIPPISFAQWNATLTFSDGRKPAPTILSAAQLEMSTALLWSLLVTSVFVLITTLIWTFIVARTNESWKTPPLIAQLYEELTGKAFDASHWERIGGEPRPPPSDPPKSDLRPVHPFIEGYPPYDPLEDGSAGDDSTVQDDPPETDWAGCLDSGSLDVFLEALTKLGYTCTSQQKIQQFTHFELHLVKIRAVTSQLSFLVYTSFFTIAAHLVSADKRHKYHLYREENELRACQFVGDYFFRRLKKYDDGGDDEDDNDVWSEGLSKALIVHPGFGSRGVDMDALLEALAKMTGTSQTVWPKMDSSVESLPKVNHDGPANAVSQVLETTLSNVDNGTVSSMDVKSPDTPSVTLPSGADLPSLPSEQSIETTEPAHGVLAVEAFSEELTVPHPEPEFVTEVMPVEQQVFIEAGPESLATPEPEAVVEFMPTEDPVVVAEHVPEPTMDAVQDEGVSFEATEQEGTPQADPVELGEFDDDLSASMLSNSALEETLVESILDDTEVKTFTPESSHTEGLGLDFGAATAVAEISSLPTPEDATPIDLPAPSESVQPVETVVGLPEPAPVAETVVVDIEVPVIPQIVVHSPDERVIAADPPIQTVSTIPAPSESVQPVEVAVGPSESVSVVETAAVDIEIPAVPEVIDHAPQELVTPAEPRTEAVIAVPAPTESVEPVEAIVGPSEPVSVVETAVDVEPPVVPQVIDHSPEELVAPVDPVETILATPEPVTSSVVLPEPVALPVLVPETITPSVVLPEPITPPVPEPVTPLLPEPVTLPVLPESVALPVLPEAVAQPVQEPTTDVDLYVQESPMSTHSELSASDFDIPTLTASQELSEPLSASEELSDSIVLVDREEPEPICITPPKYNPGMILSPIVEVPEIMTPVASEPPALIASLVEAATERGERMMYKAPQPFFRVYDDGKPLEDAPTKPFTRAGPHPPIGPAVSRPTVA